MKNKHAAPIQITAEQLLREAKERMLEYIPPVRMTLLCHSHQPPKVKFADPEELAEYRQQKRKVPPRPTSNQLQGFEDCIRRNRGLIGNWIKYAAWEDSQNEIDR